MACMTERTSLLLILMINLSYANFLARVMEEGNKKGMWFAQTTCPNCNYRVCKYLALVLITAAKFQYLERSIIGQFFGYSMNRR